jgi:hypothetical protein
MVMRGITRGLLGAAVLCMLVAGCGDDDDDASTGTTAAPTTTVATDDPTTTAGDATTTSVADDVELLVILGPDGLGFTTEGSGSITRFDFGSDPALVIDAVGRSLGDTVEEGTNDECAPGPTDFARWDEVHLFFDDTGFVGWSVNGPPLTTGDGIGVGSTLAEFEAAYGDVTVEDTSLGREFFDGPYVGSVTEDDILDRLDAGTICAFR